MKRFLVAALVVIGLTGCDSTANIQSNRTGISVSNDQGSMGITVVCVEGFEFAVAVGMRKAALVQVMGTDGLPRTCTSAQRIPSLEN